jgi:integrase
VSLKLKHVDVAEGRIDQDAREVVTKASKTITTWFFPVGTEIRHIVLEWVDYLRNGKLWGPDDPLFPATHVAPDSNRHFAVVGLSRKHWSSTTPIRAIFRNAFADAGLPYFNPHSFRKTLVQLAMKLQLTAEEFKAWSQNLGHEQVMTTFTSYGAVARSRQGEIMRAFGPSRSASTKVVAERIAELLSREFEVRGAAIAARDDEAGDSPQGSRR